MADYVWKSLLTEFLGTFTLVFVTAGAFSLTVSQGGSLVGSALAAGLAFAALIYAWGSYSGAHFNPAISFGYAVAGRMHWGLMLGYWIAQLLGGILAAALIAYFFGTGTGAGASVGTLTNTDAWRAILLEAILTFFLVITVLFVSRNPMLAVASGFAIGLVLTFDIIVGAPLTGASMNPARSLGPAIFSNNLGSYWIYIVGPLLGALVAALVYKLFTVDFSCCEKIDECGNKVLDECGNTIKVCKRPKYDNCGNMIKDCHGSIEYETFTKHERKLTHHQETPLLAIGEWMSANGFDPRYLRSEIARAINENGNKSHVATIDDLTPQGYTVKNLPHEKLVYSQKHSVDEFVDNSADVVGRATLDALTPGHATATNFPISNETTTTIRNATEDALTPRIKLPAIPSPLY